MDTQGTEFYNRTVNRILQNIVQTYKFCMEHGNEGIFFAKFFNGNIYFNSCHSETVILKACLFQIQEFLISIFSSL